MDLTPNDDVEIGSASELMQPIWSVISFDRLEAAGLTYGSALRKLDELGIQAVAGLCIVTDQAAARTGEPLFPEAPLQGVGRSLRLRIVLVAFGIGRSIARERHAPR